MKKVLFATVFVLLMVSIMVSLSWGVTYDNYIGTHSPTPSPMYKNPLGQGTVAPTPSPMYHNPNLGQIPPFSPPTIKAVSPIFPPVNYNENTAPTGGAPRVDLRYIPQ